MTEVVEHVLFRREPAIEPAPVVLDSPHSGTERPADFDYACSEALLREAEDTYVDELFAAAPSLGAGLLCALFPRSYIDPNRAVDDIDMELVEGAWPGKLGPAERSPYGMGLIRRIGRPGEPIYGRRLTVEEVRRRIAEYYRPYHDALAAMLEERHRRFGAVFHLSCHSMPSGPLHPASAGHPPRPQADFVLGDRDGTTCGEPFVRFVEERLRGLGYRVARNAPYKGVEIVRRYGRPAEGRHSLQIEVSKALYMDERSLARSAGFRPLQKDLTALIEAVCRFAREAAGGSPWPAEGGLAPAAGRDAPWGGNPS
jgi:N-formylglutamate amidohydrolase